MELLDLELCAALRLDEDGRVARVGAGFAPILGWAAAEVIGQTWHALCIPEHRARFERAFENLRLGAPSAKVRAQFPRPTESLQLVSRIARHGGGFLLVAEDVGTKAAVFEGQTSFQHLFDFTSDSWFVHDLEGRIRDANSAACRNLGYTREEMLSAVVADFETTIKPGRMDGVWNRMELGRPISVEGRQRRKDGTIIPVDVRLGLFEADGEVLMLAISRDITQLKRAEEELQALNAALEEKVAARTRDIAIALAERQAMLDSLADGIVATDAEGRVRLSNPALDELLGYAVEQGCAVDAVLPDAVAGVVREAAERGVPAHGEAKIGASRVMHVQAAPIVHEGQVDGVVALVQDVTLEREVDRMKTDFIATVSHELRTPLTSVLGFAKITRNQFESKLVPSLDQADSGVRRAIERIRKNIDIISSEGERLTALINDVLDISKMEAGRMEWNFETLDAGELVQRAVDATQALFEEIPLEVQVDADLPPIEGDEARLLQILINLLSNAAKFADGGAVSLTARALGSGVELAVRDHGIGIDPDLHPVIFDKFRQVGDTLTDKPKGTGLGLPICQQIARAHDTEITVESALGEGARFALVLGAGVGEAPASSRPIDALLQRIERRVPTMPHKASAQVLVVDDDASIRELLRQELTERGYEVRQAANGYEAIGQVRASRPDLIILDVMMPELSGFDVAAMIKNDPETEDIPILMLSILEDAQRGLRVGVDRYLTKPVVTEDLLSTVRELVDQASSPRRVLVVDESQTTTTEVARLLAKRGYEVVGTCRGADCLEKARATRPDLILLESISGNDEELLRTIRFERGLEHVYIVQLVDGEPV